MGDQQVTRKISSRRNVKSFTGQIIARRDIPDTSIHLTHNLTDIQGRVLEEENLSFFDGMTGGSGSSSILYKSNEGADGTEPLTHARLDQLVETRGWKVTDRLSIWTYGKKSDVAKDRIVLLLPINAMARRRLSEARNDSSREDEDDICCKISCLPFDDEGGGHDFSSSSTVTDHDMMTCQRNVCECFHSYRIECPPRHLWANALQKDLKKDLDEVQSTSSSTSSSSSSTSTPYPDLIIKPHQMDKDLWLEQCQQIQAGLYPLLLTAADAEKRSGFVVIALEDIKIDQIICPIIGDIGEEFDLSYLMAHNANYDGSGNDLNFMPNPDSRETRCPILLTDRRTGNVSSLILLASSSKNNDWTEQDANCTIDTIAVPYTPYASLIPVIVATKDIKTNGRIKCYCDCFTPRGSNKTKEKKEETSRNEAGEGPTTTTTTARQQFMISPQEVAKALQKRTSAPFPEDQGQPKYTKARTAQKLNRKPTKKNRPPGRIGQYRNDVPVVLSRDDEEDSQSSEEEEDGEGEVEEEQRNEVVVVGVTERERIFSSSSLLQNNDEEMASPPSHTKAGRCQGMSTDPELFVDLIVDVGDNNYLLPTPIIIPSPTSAGPSHRIDEPNKTPTSSPPASSSTRGNNASPVPKSLVNAKRQSLKVNASVIQQIIANLPTTSAANKHPRNSGTAGGSSRLSLETKRQNALWPTWSRIKYFNETVRFLPTRQYKGSFAHLAPDMWAYPTKIDRLGLLLYYKFAPEHTSYARLTIFDELMEARNDHGTPGERQSNWSTCVGVAKKIMLKVNTAYPNESDFNRTIRNQIFPVFNDHENNILIFGSGKLTHLVLCIAICWTTTSKPELKRPVKGTKASKSASSSSSAAEPHKITHHVKYLIADSHEKSCTMKYKGVTEDIIRILVCRDRHNYIWMSKDPIHIKFETPIYVCATSLGPAFAQTAATSNYFESLRQTGVSDCPTFYHIREGVALALLAGRNLTDGPRFNSVSAAALLEKIAASFQTGPVNDLEFVQIHSRAVMFHFADTGEFKAPDFDDFTVLHGNPLLEKYWAMTEVDTMSNIFTITRNIETYNLILSTSLALLQNDPDLNAEVDAKKGTRYEFLVQDFKDLWTIDLTTELQRMLTIANFFICVYAHTKNHMFGKEVLGMKRVQVHGFQINNVQQLPPPALTAIPNDFESALILCLIRHKLPFIALLYWEFDEQSMDLLNKQYNQRTKAAGSKRHKYNNNNKKLKVASVDDVNVKPHPKILLISCSTEITLEQEILTEIWGAWNVEQRLANPLQNKSSTTIKSLRLRLPSDKDKQLELEDMMWPVIYALGRLHWGRTRKDDIVPCPNLLDSLCLHASSLRPRGKGKLGYAQAGLVTMALVKLGAPTGSDGSELNCIDWSDSDDACEDPKDYYYSPPSSPSPGEPSPAKTKTKTKKKKFTKKRTQTRDNNSDRWKMITRSPVVRTPHNEFQSQLHNTSASSSGSREEQGPRTRSKGVKRKK